VAGIKAAIEGGFQLIVLDVMLPDIKGFDVLPGVRQSARTPVAVRSVVIEKDARILNFPWKLSHVLG
jgi:DNA-binding response OmpR family regulator